MKFDWFAAAFVGGMLFFAPAGWAQSADTDVLESQTEAVDRILQATGQAIDLGTLSGDPATYEEVLRDPDNIELNLRFARGQINQGNFRGASATLERILLIAPNLQQVRLLYAVVLFRQGNLDEAEKEFKKIAALELPASLRAEVEAYLDSIANIRQRTRYTASASLGGQLDSNRTTAPRSNTRLFLDTPITVDRAESDFGYIGFANMRVDHDLGFQEGHGVFAALSYYDNDQIAEDSQDLQSFMAEGGGVYRDVFLDGDLTAKLQFSQVRLSRQTFLHEYGGDLRFDRELTNNLTGFIGAHLSHQSFSPIRENATSQERDGRQLSGTVGIAYEISPEHRIALDYQRLDRNAKGRGAVEFFSYTRNQARLNHTWLLGDGQFFLNSLTYQRDRYDVPDAFISVRERHDNIFRLRVTYGAPLSFLMGRLGVGVWEPLGDITFTPSVEFTRAHCKPPEFRLQELENSRVADEIMEFLDERRPAPERPIA